MFLACSKNSRGIRVAEVRKGELDRQLQVRSYVAIVWTLVLCEVGNHLKVWSREMTQSNILI